MKAREQTEGMLRWWQGAGITHADLAVRRPGGAMIWHRDWSLDRLPLSWARAENVRGSEIYIRPARGYRWSLLFLDDVAPEMTRRVIGRYAALAVRTSPEGGCHLWLRIRQSLEESARAEAQRWLAARTGADPASISGEHLGRLAGFKNWKRGGVWVNVAAAATPAQRPWNPSPALHQQGHPSESSPERTPAPIASGTAGHDASPSGREWAWACTLLEKGTDPDQILALLIQHAASRRGSDAARYARLTLGHALQRTAALRARC